MEKVRMMKKIDSLMDKDFKYLYQKEHANLTELHYSFKMDSQTHELQAGMQFEERYVDVLVFISPTVLVVGSPEYYEAIKACNSLNWCIKSFGRFYVDGYGDLAYSLRFSYDFINREPEHTIEQIEAAIDCYADVFVPLLNVCLGEKTAAEFEEYLDEIW